MWQALQSIFGGGGPKAGAASPDTATERRVWVRRPCDVSAYFQPASQSLGDRQAARVRNISRGGISVIVGRRVEPGAMLSVELPGADDRPGISVLACVVHAAPQADGEWALGCSFSQELGDDDLEPFGAKRARTAPSDQRAWQRFPCKVEAIYGLVRAAKAGKRQATVVNISANGTALLVNSPIDVGALLNLYLRRSDRHDDLEILACVVRVTPQGHGQWLLGCNFISELSDELMQAFL